jgi:hypothetical protein
MSSALTAPFEEFVESTKAMDREDWAETGQTVSSVFAVLMLGWGIASLIGVNMAARATWMPGPDVTAMGVETADPLASLQSGLWFMTQLGFGLFAAGMAVAFLIEWQVDWDE